MLDTIVESKAVDKSSLPYIELGFPIIAGNLLPADNAYGSYSAISHAMPLLHDRNDISIQSIAGKPYEPGKIQVSSRSQIKIRMPYESEIISAVLPLAGQTLTIGVHEIQLGIPMMSPLQPFSVLRSRITTIKKFQEAPEFLLAAQRQLDALEIKGTANIPLNGQGVIDRKVIKIKSYTIVGFGLEVSDLSDEDSLRLQIVGLGGKHKMGCGIFNPLPKRVRMINE